VRLAWRPDAAVMVNSSRAILYAGAADHGSMAAAAEAARAAALATRAALQRGRARAPGNAGNE